ncbi:MAG: hypothetical protein ACREMG_01800 [Gemmatimonadales bacterium]
MGIQAVVAYAVALSLPVWLAVEEITRGNPVAGGRRAAPVRLRDRKTV